MNCRVNNKNKKIFATTQNLIGLFSALLNFIPVNIFVKNAYVENLLLSFAHFKKG